MDVTTIINQTISTTINNLNYSQLVHNVLLVTPCLFTQISMVWCNMALSPTGLKEYDTRPEIMPVFHVSKQGATNLSYQRT